MGGGEWARVPTADQLSSSSGADKGGDPELVRESQRRRFKDVSQVDQVIELDAEWRSVRYELDNFQKELNSISKEVGQIKKVISVLSKSCHAVMGS